MKRYPWRAVTTSPARLSVRVLPALSTRRRPIRRGLLFAMLCLALLTAANPASAWYFFLESNGQRQQWVFGSSCNSSSRPIKLVRDSDMPSGYVSAPTVATSPLGNAANAWNFGSSGVALTSGQLFDNVNAYTATMDLTQVKAFMANPFPNEVRVVWDADGSIFNYLGVDPSSGVLGVGIALTGLNRFRSQDICAGILFLNASAIGSANGPLLNAVAKHELGHVLGFAHSIAGGNGSQGSGFAAPTVTVTSVNRPVMFPYLCSVCPAQTALNEDDYAAVRTYYGP